MADATPDILFVDDDPYYLKHAADALRFRGGYHIREANSVDEALECLNLYQFKLVIMDLMMPPGKSFDAIETASGYKAGIPLAREVLNRIPNVKLIVNTGSPDHSLEVFLSGNHNVAFLVKNPTDPGPLFRAADAALRPGLNRLKAFIVHGRDTRSVHDLDLFLRKRLSFEEPMVLADLPSRGRTILEKFEYYATQADVVFVLVTPDDVGNLAGCADAAQFRARQNVIFELGYFLGWLKRQSGRVILLYKGDVEIPSDINGLAYINIEQGLDSVLGTIQAELATLMPFRG